MVWAPLIHPFGDALLHQYVLSQSRYFSLLNQSIGFCLFEQTTNSLCFSSENQQKKSIHRLKANEKLSTKTFSFFFAASILFLYFSLSKYPSFSPSVSHFFSGESPRSFFFNTVCVNPGRSFCSRCKRIPITCFSRFSFFDRLIGSFAIIFSFFIT